MAMPPCYRCGECHGPFGICETHHITQTNLIFKLRLARARNIVALLRERSSGITQELSAGSVRWDRLYFRHNSWGSYRAAMSQYSSRLEERALVIEQRVQEILENHRIRMSKFFREVYSNDPN